MLSTSPVTEWQILGLTFLGVLAALGVFVGMLYAEERLSWPWDTVASLFMLVGAWLLLCSTGIFVIALSNVIRMHYG